MPSKLKEKIILSWFQAPRLLGVRKKNPTRVCRCEAVREKTRTRICGCKEKKSAKIFYHLISYFY